MTSPVWQSIRRLRPGFLVLSLLMLLSIAGGWGFEAHKLVNSLAVDRTTGKLGQYFDLHRMWLAALSVAPDTRRSYDPAEGPNHYIDLEYYGEYPFSDIPHDWQEAQTRYGKDKLPEWGTLPWRVSRLTQSLSDAMKDGNWELVIVMAADLGHYVADAHMPFHNTVNYNGQDSGNDGIHHLFESFMVNRYLDDFTPPLSDPVMITEPIADILAWCRESYPYVAEILAADDTARSNMSPDEIAILAQGWGTAAEDIPDEYYVELYARTGSIAWRQMDLAAARTAALWNWAWNQAGSPDPPL